MTSESRQSAEREHQYHHYTGNRIPWYVRLMWLFFWAFAIVYTLRFVFPMLEAEILGQ
jgi:hypothetical protein